MGKPIKFNVNFSYKSYPHSKSATKRSYLLHKYTNWWYCIRYGIILAVIWVCGLHKELDQSLVLALIALYALLFLIRVVGNITIEKQAKQELQEYLLRMQK